MEWTIPLDTMELSEITIGTPVQSSKLISPLSYSDGDATFINLCLLLPLLPVKSYDVASGRLIISLQGCPIANKLITFQDMLINTVIKNQDKWFKQNPTYTKQNIYQGFQPFIENGAIHLYCPSSSMGLTNEIYIYNENAWSRGIISPTLFAPGKQVKLAIKFQGLSFHQQPVSKTWTGKFRLQHRIVAILTV
ncbi:hypothetical protein EBR66_02495 [bacterium]|nr:hypothetical protein [bacterium]